LNGQRSIEQAEAYAKYYLIYKFDNPKNAWFKEQMDKYISFCDGAGAGASLEKIERSLFDKKNSAKDSTDGKFAELAIYQHTADVLDCWAPTDEDEDTPDYYYF